MGFWRRRLHPPAVAIAGCEGRPPPRGIQGCFAGRSCPAMGTAKAGTAKAGRCARERKVERVGLPSASPLGNPPFGIQTRGRNAAATQFEIWIQSIKRTWWDLNPHLTHKPTHQYGPACQQNCRCGALPVEPQARSSLAVLIFEPNICNGENSPGLFLKFCLSAHQSLISFRSSQLLHS
jgi:hypothetical protein